MFEFRCALLVAVLVPGIAYSQTADRTVLDGVYSDVQSIRGQNVYKSACAECHGASLEGVSAPELTGKRFMDRWREGTLDGIYSFIRQRMPLGRPANDASARPPSARLPTRL